MKVVWNQICFCLSLSHDHESLTEKSLFLCRKPAYQRRHVVSLIASFERVIRGKFLAREVRQINPQSPALPPPTYEVHPGDLASSVPQVAVSSPFCVWSHLHCKHRSSSLTSISRTSPLLALPHGARS